MTVVGMFDEIKKNDLIIKLKKQLREAEGELSIIKGINFNSDKQKEINILEEKVKEAREINKLHQELNGKLRQEFPSYSVGIHSATITREYVVAFLIRIVICCVYGN